jgi:hypothetical protein
VDEDALTEIICPVLREYVGKELTPDVLGSLAVDLTNKLSSTLPYPTKINFWWGRDRLSGSVTVEGVEYEFWLMVEPPIKPDELMSRNEIEFFAPYEKQMKG